MLRIAGHMARLRDAGTVIRRVGPREFFQRLWVQIDEDNVFAWASSLSYSWILALFPFLIFLISLIPHLPAPAYEAAREQIKEVIDTLPREARETVGGFVDKRLKAIVDYGHTSLLTVGVVVTLWAASGGIAATTKALDKAWDVDLKRSFVRRRISAMVLTVIVTALLAVIIVLLPIGTVVLDFIRNKILPEWQPVLFAVQVVRWVVGVAVMFLVIEVVYFFGPNIRQRWRWVSPGSLFCAVCWVVLGMVFRFYVDRFGKYGETYGAVGGVAILLLVFYFDAMALLVGAEINSEIDFELLGVIRGSRDFTKRIDAPATGE